MKFLPLFQIRLEHDYYRSGLCPDFELVPSAASELVLRNHRIVFRSQAHGGRAYMEINQRSAAVNPIVPFTADSRLIFHLRLKNPQLPLFTVLDERLQRTVFDPELGQRRLRAAPYYSNRELPSGKGGELALGVRRATHSETLTVVTPQQGERFVLNGKPSTGLQVENFAPLPDSVHITHYDRAARQLTIDTRGAEKGTLLTVSYPVFPILDRGVFADIELNELQALVPNPDPVRFTLSFQAPEMRWVYYFVTGKSGSVGNGIPTITDKNVPPRIEFDRWQLHPESSTPDPAEVVNDAIADKIATQYPDHRRFRFLSRQTIPCRQATRKKLELSFSTLNHPMATNLTNPPLRNISEIVIKSGLDPPKLVKSIFHVIEH